MDMLMAAYPQPVDRDVWELLYETPANRRIFDAVNSELQAHGESAIYWRTTPETTELEHKRASREMLLFRRVYEKAGWKISSETSEEGSVKTFKLKIGR